MALRYKICLFVVKLFEDYGINVDRAELLSLSILIFLKEHPIMILSKIVISTCHVCTCKCVGEPATYREVM